MPTPVRVAFLGNDPWSVPSLERLAETAEIDVALVVTRDPRPARRGSRRVPTPVSAAARRRGLPLVETPTVRGGEGLERLRQCRPDALAVVAYGELLPPAVLAVAAAGAVNLHFSRLPRWRGAAPVQRAIMAGDPVTGVTTMLLDEGLDTGPILQQADEPVRDDDDAGSLGSRLAVLGGPLLVSSILGLVAGTLEPRPQEGPASEAPKVSSADRVLRWSDASAALLRRIRALSPEPGATTAFRGDLLKVWRAEPAGATGEPGSIVRVDGAGIVIATRDGGVRPLEVSAAGRHRMSAAAWALGARPREGERFG